MGLTAAAILTVLASLEPGYTYCPSSNTRLYHASWRTSLWRSFVRYDRHSTLDFITKALNGAMEEVTLSQHGDDLIKIFEAIKGVHTLCQTYHADSVFQVKVDELCNKLFTQARDLQRKIEVSNSTVLFLPACRVVNTVEGTRLY